MIKTSRFESAARSATSRGRDIASQARSSSAALIRAGEGVYAETQSSLLSRLPRKAPGDAADQMGT